MKQAVAVVDVGATNTRVVLMDENLNELESRKSKTIHVDGPRYKSIDVDALLDFILASIMELDRVRPVGTISVSAFGATIACVDSSGDLVFPVMDYLAEPPDHVVEEYARIAPPFDEVYSNVSPSALTIARQLYWLETEYNKEFEQVQHVIPLSGYIGFRLGGAPSMEISNLGVFTHLIDVKTGQYSTLVVSRGWDKLFPPIRKAWEVIGHFHGQNGEALAGAGEILCGIHDSNANLLRYLATQAGNFTLLSTGTFLIGLDSSADLSGLKPDNDTFSFNDIFGRPVAGGRFYGGYEFNELIGDESPDAATRSSVQALIDERILALPSFSDTGGPIPGRGNKGKIIGDLADTPEFRVSLANLYYALMANEVLNALRSTGVIIIDGPVAENPILTALIAQLRAPQMVVTSSISEGTTLGAGVLALMKGSGATPDLELDLSPTEPASYSNINAYEEAWRNEIARDTN